MRHHGGERGLDLLDGYGDLLGKVPGQPGCVSFVGSARLLGNNPGCSMTSQTPATLPDLGQWWTDAQAQVRALVYAHPVVSLAIVAGIVALLSQSAGRRAR